MVNRITCAVVVCLLAGACASAPKGPSIADKMFELAGMMSPSSLARAMATPLTFTVPKDKSDEAWGRVNSFIARYSTMKIQTASDYIIQTYNPTDKFNAYGYTANRMTKGDAVEISVDCVYVESYQKQAIRNAHLLAHYAATGELVDESLISR